MGRSVYHGIYEPEHPLATADGFRQDVIDLVKPLRLPLVRYPGGNFLSAYEWEDGVGPVRVPTLDPAWRQKEPNAVGTDEFHRWAKLVGTDVLMAVNLGTREAVDAMHLLEYCNFPAGSKYADQRVANGQSAPYGDKVWCLGNEMDGIWQVGHRTAEDYAAAARKTACAMKMLDPSIELVACGSSSPDMPTFGVWERTVLGQTYDQVDYISLHRYYLNEGRDSGEYLACSMEMERFIDAVAAQCDAVGSELHRNKKIHLAFDEWNVWAKKRSDNEEGLWTVGPRREEYEFSMEDALTFGTLLIALMNHCDRVKIACLAQLVNVCAPIMTENGGKAWAQTTYYPFLHASKFGRGTALRLQLDCPTYQAGRYGETPFVAASAVLSPQEETVTLFVVNRSLTEDAEVSIDGLAGYEISEHIVMKSDDLDATNTALAPNRVRPTAAKIAPDHKVFVEKASWNVIRLKAKE